MTTTTKRWPHPTVRVSASDVAGLLGVSRTSLSKPIARIRAGLPSGTRKPEIGIAAGIFAAQATGPVPRVEAGALIDALRIPVSQVDQTPPPLQAEPKERRHRLSKKEVAQMQHLPLQKIYGVFQKAADHVATRNNPNARRRLHETIKVMIKRGIAFPVSVIPGEGVKPENFRPFASLAEWVTKAGPDDFRLFVLVGGKGRPVDYPLAPRRALAKASFKFMTLSAWLRAMKRGLIEEFGEAEQSVLEKVTRAARKPNLPRKRA
jgi:hypothetical protein